MPGRRYLELLGGNFLRLPNPERAEFIARLRHDAEAITDHDLGVLLSSEWRARLTAGWLIATSKRAQYRDQLGDILVASQLVYAGQGFSIALASIGGDASAVRLSEYLDRWLPETTCRYDQHWAMAALVCLDDRLGSTYSARFLGPDGPWESWNRGQPPLEEQVQLTRTLLAEIGA